MKVSITATHASGETTDIVIDITDFDRDSLRAAALAMLPAQDTYPYEIQLGEPTVKLRELKQLLERDIVHAPDVNLHWVSVLDENSIDAAEASIPLSMLTDCIWNVIVQHGWSEGTLLYVAAQRDRYEPKNQQVLFRIKTLNGLARCHPDIQAIMAWFGDEAWRRVASPV